MKFIENFLLGGTLVSVISYLATYVSPLLAAIVWSFPLSLIPTIYSMKSEGKSNKTIGKFLFNTTFSLGLLFIVTLSLSYFISRAKDGLLMPILASAGIWAVFSVIYYFIMK
jgi:hypothetical protein